MKKGTILFVIALVVLAIYAGSLLSSGPVHGYDGPVASFESIDSAWGDTETVTQTTAVVNPSDDTALGTLGPTGLRAELGQPNVLTSTMEEIDEISTIIIDEEAETNTTKTLKVYKIKCQMGVTVTTTGNGLAKITNVVFWIQIEENQYSVFTDAQESTAYILNIYTRDKATTSGDIEVRPTAGGYDFSLTTVQTEDAPQWIIDSGYTGNLRYFRKVKFDIEVISAAPSHFLGGWRTEAYATFDIGIDVLLFGYWEQVKDYRKWEWPETWWEQLLTLIIEFLWIIVGLVATIVVLWKAPGYYKLLGLVVIWGIVAWQLGWLDPLLARVGL